MNQIALEVERAVIEQGSLNKAQVVETWELSDEQYRDLRETLQRRGRVESGPQRTGGFAAKQQRGTPSEDSGEAILREDWEDAVVTRLADLLSHKELEGLLGELAYTVRQSRVARGLDDRRGTKHELASALVIQHGVDLLAPTAMREALAKSLSIPFPQKWHPGKRGAIDFVRLADLPAVLAGLPSEEAPPSMEYLEGHALLAPLQDFQDEVRHKLFMGIGTRHHRSIVTLPTGGGKTRVAVQGIRDWLVAIYEPKLAFQPGACVVWLAHTEELCEQACSCFRQVWQGSESAAPMTLVRFWGGHNNSGSEVHETLLRAVQSTSVVVSTPHRIVNLLKSEDPQSAALRGALGQSLGLLVVDEAHRAAAPSYRRILHGLVRPEVPVVGLTATPFRMEYHDGDPEAGTQELKEIFQNLIEPIETLGANPRVRLQERGVLAQPSFQVIETGIFVKMPSASDSPLDEDIERIDRILATKTDLSSRRLSILETLVPLAWDANNLILYFGPSVRDAECMAYLLRERQIPAAVVSGSTRESTRRRVIERFKRGEFRVLCNCEVLATGFDAPRVTHVVMARPTVSQVMYEQMVGRGMRGKAFGGTEVCTILDCVDTMTGPVRPELGYKRFRRVWKQEMDRG